MRLLNILILQLALFSSLSYATVNTTDMTFESWKNKNSKLTVDGKEVSYRIVGSGPWLTLLHGFPTSSMDWAKVLPQLSQHYTVLIFDFIGFGDSAKPTNYKYSTFERAALTEEIWRQLGITSTSVVAHDFAATVLLELLYRKQKGRLNTEIEKTVFLNGGLFTDLHRPLLAQKILLNPWAGPIFSRLITYKIFNKQFRSSLAIQPDEVEIQETWKSIIHRDGLKNYHKLIRYIQDRRDYRDHWEPLVSDDSIPKKFIWGLKDPISGEHMLNEIIRRNPKANVAAIPEVGHFPQLENPERVAQEIIDFLK